MTTSFDEAADELGEMNLSEDPFGDIGVDDAG